MPDFKIETVWINSDEHARLLQNTTAALTMRVDGEALTRNINGWTGKEEESVVVSTYPLAKWFAFNWWRLANEFLPLDGGKPDFDWRTAHEMGAVNHGYVWPKVLFVSDGDFVNVWADVIPTPEQSVNYLGKLESVHPIPVGSFQKEVASVIEATIDRLDGLDAALPELWKVVCEDMQNAKLRNIRAIEAILGYDPEECPEERLNMALQFQKKTGMSSVKEILPFLSSSEQLKQCLEDGKGMEIHLQIGLETVASSENADVLPWQKGVGVARRLRQACGFGDDAIGNKELLDLLGIPSNGFEEYYRYSEDVPLSVGKNRRDGGWTFVPKKKRMMAGRRFELSRLLGDALMFKDSHRQWLVTSDYKTARQKVQRAFAAEFLCPISGLDSFMDGDYSKAVQKKAAEHYQVSEQTVNSVLMNNNRIDHCEPVFPY